MEGTALSFDEAAAKERGRTIIKPVGEGLMALGIRPDKVEHVIATHMHWDHAGNYDLFPNARYHIQDAEMAYATGRYMQYPGMNHPYEVDDVCGVVRLNYGGRVVFHNGDAELAAGIGLHFAGGHSAGLQFVTVETARGKVVLASDASHYYENFESGRPFPIAFHVGMMHEAYDKLRSHAPRTHIVPGHDPRVMTLYPPPSPELAGQVVRLDVAPLAEA